MKRKYLVIGTAKAERAIALTERKAKERADALERIGRATDLGRMMADLLGRDGIHFDLHADHEPYYLGLGDPRGNRIIPVRTRYELTITLPGTDVATGFLNGVRRGRR